MDADDDGPTFNNSAYMQYYIYVFLLAGTYFLVNLFVGVIQLNYNIAARKAKNKYLTDDQSRWIELQRLILKAEPDYNAFAEPTNKYQKAIWALFKKSNLMTGIVMTCIVMNIVTMGMSYETASTDYNSNLKSINLFFTSVFICECAMKLFAFGVKGYFSEGWN